MRHGRVEIVAERVPARQDGLLFDPRFEQAQRGRLGDLDRGDRRIGQPFVAQGIGAADKQRADPAEIVHQALRERLGVDARDGQREQIFDQLIIVEAFRARRRAGACATARDGRLRHASSLLPTSPSMPPLRD